MIYPFSLQLVGLAVGLALILSHAFALVSPAPVGRLLRALPRNRAAGTVLLAIAALWSFWLVQTVDLGEFARLRGILAIGVPVGAVLAWRFLEEFLAVRALGILALLIADIPLDAAFLRPEVSRLFLVSLAYVWILAGLFLVGMPYVLRDIIAWLLSSPSRYRGAAVAGIAYGALLVGCALALW